MAEAVLKGETTMDTLKEKSKNFDYYREAYGAVLDGMVGVFKAEIPVSEAPPEYVSENQDQDSGTIWVTKYGLKAFLPSPRAFPTMIMMISGQQEAMALSASTWAMT